MLRATWPPCRRSKPARRRGDDKRLASCSSPDLSDNEISARLTGTRSVTRLSIIVAAQLERRNCHSISAPPPAVFAVDHQLHRPARMAAAVDRQAFLDRDRPAARAEVPRRRPARAQDRAHAVGGHGRLDARGEMEADRERHRRPRPPRRARAQLVGAAQFLAVIAEHQTCAGEAGRTGGRSRRGWRRCG